VTATTGPLIPFQQEWDAGDLGCGELVIELRFRLKAMRPGEVIRVHATDLGAPADLPAWCRMTKDILVHHDNAARMYYIQRGAY
jgi:tRNA 2-thiouridine synthesizing protein A